MWRAADDAKKDTDEIRSPTGRSLALDPVHLYSTPLGRQAGVLLNDVAYTTHCRPAGLNDERLMEIRELSSADWRQRREMRHHPAKPGQARLAGDVVAAWDAEQCKDWQEGERGG